MIAKNLEDFPPQPIHFNNMQHEVVFFWLRLLILLVSLGLPIVNVAFFKKTHGLYPPAPWWTCGAILLCSLDIEIYICVIIMIR